MQNKEIIGYTWSPTASIRTLKCILEDASKHKSRVKKLYFIGEFLQANVKHSVFVKLDSRYGEYFPGYAKYCGIPLRLKNSMYGMTNSGNKFSNEITTCLMYEAGFKWSQFQMSVFKKYAPYGSKLVVLYYVCDCVYWC